MHQSGLPCCQVREKMLFSSSRENFKTTLGVGHFNADYLITELADLSWDSFRASQDGAEAPLSEMETLIKHEAGLEREVSAGRFIVNNALHSITSASRHPPGKSPPFTLVASPRERGENGTQRFRGRCEIRKPIVWSGRKPTARSPRRDVAQMPWRILVPKCVN